MKKSTVHLERRFSGHSNEGLRSDLVQCIGHAFWHVPFKQCCVSPGLSECNLWAIEEKSKLEASEGDIVLELSS